MNILFIAQRIPFPANKGEKIRSFNQAKYLADLGHHIHVISPIENKNEIAYVEQLGGLDNFSCEYALLPNKPLRLLGGLLKNESLSVANFYSIQLQKKIDNTLKQRAFDAVICTSSAMAKYIYKSNSIGKLKKKPLLLMDFMDLDSDKWRQYTNTSNWPMKWVYQREAKILAKLENKITLDFDASFFIADAEVELFKSRNPHSGKVMTLSNGMDTKLFVPAESPPDNKSPVFLFTGVMDYKPNVDAVVWFVESVWPKILAKYPNSRFIIAGMNPSNAVKDLEKTKGIEATGFVDDILPYYHQSDYFVAPFRLARGVQNKVLQAFACGLPVISTPMGAEGIDCSVDKDILIANSPEDFLTSIDKLENDCQRKYAIRDNALALVHNHYSWQGKLKILDDVLSGKV